MTSGKNTGFPRNENSTTDEEQNSNHLSSQTSYGHLIQQKLMFHETCLYHFTFQHLKYWQSAVAHLVRKEVWTMTLSHRCIYSKSEKVCGTGFSFKKNCGKSAGHFWAIFGHFGSFFGHFGPFWVIIGSLWTILGHFWPFRGIFGQFCGKLKNFCGSIGVTLSRNSLN